MNLTEKVPSKCKPKFQKKTFNFSDKTNHKNSFFAGVLYLDFLVSNRYFCQRQDWNLSKILFCGEITRWRKLKQFSCDVFFVNTHSWRTLASFGYSCVPMHTNFFNILCFSCQGKSRDIVYQRTCLFSWLIFAKHGLFGIQLTAYSARSRLTYHRIYYIIRWGIWLLTIFHIPYIHFQRELRKITSPKWYLSFFFFFWFNICSNWPVTIIFTVWEIYTTNVKPKNLKVIIFPIPSYLKI